MVWVDQRRFIVWIWPIGALGVIWWTGWLGYGIHMEATEDFGDKVSKQVTILVIFFILFLAGIYACVGIYQAFVIELRRKFIVSKVVPLGRHYYLDGYYFKKAEFDADEVAAVYPYELKGGLGRGRQIATLLAKAPQTKTPNYRVVLKDEREFYLPAEMRGVEGLVRELRGDRWAT